MRNLSPVILGIDPTARQLGVAVLQDDELVFYAVKSFEKRSREETLGNLRKVIAGLLAEYRVAFAAIERIGSVQQERSFVKIVYEEATGFIRARRGVRLLEYHPKLIRRAVCHTAEAKPTRANTAWCLSREYPELDRYRRAPNLWQTRYYALIFGAVAAAAVCAREIKKPNPLLE